MSPSAAKLRHDLRGGMNALRLSLSALELETDRDSAAEWLDTMARAADKCLRALEGLEELQRQAAAEPRDVMESARCRLRAD